MTQEYELLSLMGVYIQKSKTFLWPLLNIKAKPIETYLKFGEMKPTDETRILIALFYNGDQEYLKHKSDIESHKFYDFTFTDGDFDIITFNMYSMKDDYDKIIEGKYSQISYQYKLFISAIEKNPIVLKCLEPENNYREFARILEISPEELEGKELLSRPNPDEETIYVLPSIKKEIVEEYGFS